MEAGPLPSGEAGLAQRRRARWRPALCPRGPLPSGEAGLVQKALGETEASPLPSGEAGLAQRRRVRQNLTFIIWARNATAALSVQKFLTFDGYWFHLLGYPGIRSPTVAPETPGDSDRTAWRVFF